jgi:hypothetical protein
LQSRDRWRISNTDALALTGSTAHPCAKPGCYRGAALILYRHPAKPQPGCDHQKTGAPPRLATLETRPDLTTKEVTPMNKSTVIIEQPSRLSPEERAILARFATRARGTTRPDPGTTSGGSIVVL